jgi:hypothetical protein
MGRWFFAAVCLVVVGALGFSDATRAEHPQPLGGICESTHDCQKGTTCQEIDGVLNGQCSASCNGDDACREPFGRDSLCLGADVCARSCEQNADCPEGTRCNAYRWCERKP